MDLKAIKVTSGKKKEKEKKRELWHMELIYTVLQMFFFQKFSNVMVDIN